MKYRPFGKLDFQGSALGFGTMRLPVRNGNVADVDEDEAIAMIRYAIDAGVNYFDTAQPYHGENSERVLGKALLDGYRERVRIATKLPTWACQSKDDFDRHLDAQFERLGVDYIDFYLLHNLQVPFWKKVRDLGVRDWMDRLLDSGRVGHVGFSFHDSFSLLEEIIGAYDQWTVCQVQYNYMNEDVQGGTKGVALAAEKGLAVVVMEPLLGGCLVSAPDSVQAVWDAAPIQRSPAEWALQWLWNKPEIAVVLSGMSTMTQVEENVVSASRSGIGSMTQEELDTIAKAQQAYAAFHVIPCTGCGYCMPCPRGINIPKQFQLYNDATVFGGNQQRLNRNIYHCAPENERASACIACGACEKKCPQTIPIREWMPKVHEQFV